jgi:electron transfer flavoprotein alpha subunit
MTQTECIMVIGEYDGAGLRMTTREVLRLGRRLADGLHKKLCLCLLGEGITAFAEQGFTFGADDVIMASDPTLAPYTADAWLAALDVAVSRVAPALILFGHTDSGMELAPRLAFRLKTGVVLDCSDISCDGPDDPLIYVKPVFGGKALGHVRLGETHPQIATIREGALDPADADPQHGGNIIPMALSLDPQCLRVRWISKQIDANLAQANRLASAGIVVAAGRGVKNREGVDLAARTAESMGGAVAASRPVVDQGWLPYSLQIGLTGKKIHPQLYIAAGISGAIQHMAGCLKAKTIVAVNNDETAPIFKMAHIGVVGDFKAVFTGLFEELKLLSHSNPMGNVK